MRWNNHRFQIVDLLEFVCLGIGRSGHAGKLAVQAKIILKGDRGERLVFLLDGHPFLGFHRLVQTVRPAASRHQAPGELIHDHHFAVLHHVMLIAVEQVVRAQCSIQMVDQSDVGGIVQTAASRQQAGLGEHIFCMLVAGFGQ